MKVIDNRTIKTTLTFADLPIGEGYYDNNGLLCIKTSDYEGDNNCIVYVEEEGWHEDFETRGTIVRPVRTILTVEG